MQKEKQKYCFDFNYIFVIEHRFDSSGGKGKYLYNNVLHHFIALKELMKYPCYINLVRMATLGNQHKIFR